MAYHWATSCVEETATEWVATMVLLASAAFSMRESMLVVMVVPLGLGGDTTPEYGVTARLVYAKPAEVVSTPVILMTSIEVLLPCSVKSHIGSPATESCMVVGRTLKSLRSLRATCGEATAFIRSAAFTATTSACPPPLT